MFVKSGDTRRVRPLNIYLGYNPLENIPIFCLCSLLCGQDAVFVFIVNSASKCLTAVVLSDRLEQHTENAPTDATALNAGVVDDGYHVT